MDCNRFQPGPADVGGHDGGHDAAIGNTHGAHIRAHLSEATRFAVSAQHHFCPGLFICLVPVQHPAEHPAVENAQSGLVVTDAGKQTAAVGRGNFYFCRCLSVYALEKWMFETLSFAAGFSFEILASRQWCSRSMCTGAQTRIELSGLLLGGNADHVCSGRHESARHGSDHLADPSGKNAAWRCQDNLQNFRLIVYRLGIYSDHDYLMAGSLGLAPRANPP